MTTMAKKMGGPEKLVEYIFLAGATAGGAVIFGAGWIKKKWVEHCEKKNIARLNSKIFTICKDGKSNEGLLFKEGEHIRVLEMDGEMVLIERVGDENSPYCVSKSFLVSISDFDEA